MQVVARTGGCRSPVATGAAAPRRSRGGRRVAWGRRCLAPAGNPLARLTRRISSGWSWRPSGSRSGWRFSASRRTSCTRSRKACCVPGRRPRRTAWMASGTVLSGKPNWPSCQAAAQELRSQLETVRQLVTSRKVVARRSQGARGKQPDPMPSVCASWRGVGGASRRGCPASFPRPASARKLCAARCSSCGWSWIVCWTGMATKSVDWPGCANASRRAARGSNGTKRNSRSYVRAVCALARSSRLASWPAANWSLSANICVRVFSSATGSISAEAAIMALLDPDFDGDTAAARRELLQRKIDEIGEVNLTAIDEYREMEERHAYLAAQQDDLQRSLDGLQAAIVKINRTTRRRFRETFDQVNSQVPGSLPAAVQRRAGRTAPDRRGGPARDRHRDRGPAARQEAAERLPAVRR